VMARNIAAGLAENENSSFHHTNWWLPHVVVFRHYRLYYVGKRPKELLCTIEIMDRIFPNDIAYHGREDGKKLQAGKVSLYVHLHLDTRFQPSRNDVIKT